MQAIIDSSHLITFGISILVIVYGSFRSLSMDRKSEPGEEKAGLLDALRIESSTEKIDLFETDADAEVTSVASNSVQTIDSIQALFIPVVASISLLFMFFFFDSIQTAFVICTSGRSIKNYLVYV